MTEIRVNSRTGRWETIGENGAEFVNINPNDIIFNHLQTASLLHNGYAAGRGKSFVNGTAYASGTSYASGSKVLEKFQKWFGKLFDWIEVKLERQARKIDKYVKSAERYSKNSNYASAKKEYDNAIAATQTQIGYQTSAVSKYDNQAEKILKRAVKKGVISKKRANSIRKKMANGTLDISSYGERTQEVLSDYKEYYEKARDAEEAILDLQDQLEEYKEAKYQLGVDNAENYLNRLKAEGENLNSLEDKHNNINAQIKATQSYYDLMIDHESDANKKAQLRAEKEKAVRDLLKEQLDIIKEQVNYIEGFYNSVKSGDEALEELRKAAGTDSFITQFNTFTDIYKNRLNLAEYLRDSAAKFYAQLDPSDTASYFEGLAEYNNMIAEAYQAEAEAYQAQYDAWYALNISLRAQLLEDYQTKADLLNAQIDLNGANGIKATIDNYNDLIRNSESQVNLLKQQNTFFLAQQENYKPNSEKYRELKKLIDDNNKAILEAEKNQVEWNNAIIQLDFDKIENSLKVLDSVEKYYESIISLNSQLGRDSSQYDYESQIKQITKRIDLLNEEEETARTNWGLALLNGGVYGGKTSDEWKSQYMDFKAQINSAEAELDKLRDTMRDDIYWRNFERMHKVAEKLEATLSNVAKLIDDSMAFDKDGNITAYGIAQMSLLVKQFENAQTEVNNYANDIENLNKLYAQGYYTETEYSDKLAEIQNNLLGSAANMKSYLDSIKNMYKQMDQEELNNLKELISKRKEALNKKKA